ncbi:MAG: Ig-like domain-containing protein [Thermoplasmatota archaeon]
MKKIPRLAPLLMIAFIVISALSVPEPTDGARSGDYPRNYEIQDYEPSADEQWDLDVVMDDEGRLYSVWADFRDKVPEVRFSKSLNGTSWGDGEFNNNDIVVSDGPNTDERVDHPSITVDEDRKLYCIWLDDRGGEVHVRMTTSTSLGSSWNQSRRVPEITGSVSQPFIRYSAETGIMSIVYVKEYVRDNGSSPQKDIMYTYSTDKGESFSTPIVLNDDDTDEDQTNPRITLSKEGWIAVIWQDFRNGDSTIGRNSDVYSSISKDGIAFSENFLVHDDPGSIKQVNPDATFSENSDLMVVWQETGLDGWQIKYSMAWTASKDWNGEFLPQKVAISSNLSRKDQFLPRVGYVEGSFLMAWTELDLRNFYLVRAGYISRYGEMVSGDHIVDDTIDMGMYEKEPIYHAEMYKETVSVLGRGERGHVFWMDYRTDPNPSDDRNQDADPYTAIPFSTDEVPLSPQELRLKLVEKDWNSIKVRWPVSPDIGFKGYYLSYGEGVAPVPDENLNDAKIIDRLANEVVFSGLTPDTRYQVRMVVKDRIGQAASSPVLDLRTGSNQAPNFEFLEPDGIHDRADKEYTIRWRAFDKEEAANYTLHYDNDMDPSDQVFLYAGNTMEDLGEMELVWNTTGLPSGGYTINATIYDGVNPPVTVYSNAVIVSHPTAVRDHPTVRFITVDGGKENAFVDPILEITFDKPIAPTTIDEESIYILDSSNIRVPGTISIFSPEKLNWRPENHLEFGTEHRIQILPTVTDLDGNELDGEKIGEPSPFSLVFTTRPEAGEPEIKEWSPQGQDVPLWTDISVEFDRPMDNDSITSETVSLLEISSSTEVPIRIEYRESLFKLEISLRRPLTANHTYKLNLSGIRSRLDAVMSPFQWTFSAGQPDLDTDTDGDGVPDDLDWFRYDPTESRDTDMDGIGDNADLDADGDGMPDSWEEKWGLDPLDPTDADEDPDGDGMTNLEEFRAGTTPVEDESDDIDRSLLILILVGISVLIILALIGYSIYQRRRFQDQRLQEGFFREGDSEE